MGREIKRVPLDFVFPLGESYHDAAWAQHKATCREASDHDDCEIHMSPPHGEGWQLWQTVSDGPISPVFATPEELIDFMSAPVPDADRAKRQYDPDPYPKTPQDRGWRREAAERFVRGRGWMPSMAIVGGKLMGPNEMAESGLGEPDKEREDG